MTPAGVEEPDDPGRDLVPGEPQKALELLVNGTTAATTARALAVSPRLLYTQLSAVRRTLGASTPYLLGVLAIRSGIVPPVTVIDHARAGRGRDGWVAPTPVQHELLRLLATGSTYRQAATSLGASSRTLQRRFRELAEANGIERLLRAGALFRSARLAPATPSSPHDAEAVAIGL